MALSKNFTLRKTANFPFAFISVLCICLSQFNDEESHCPICRCWCTLSIKPFSKIWGGELKRYFFCENMMSLLLPELNETLHVFAQLLFFSKSLLRTSAVIAGSSSETNKQVSSAKRRHSYSKFSIISCISIIQSKGPSLLPWGTPASISQILLLQLSTTVQILRFRR